MEVIPTLEEEVSKIQYLEIEPHTESVGEDKKITKQGVDIDPLVLIQVEIAKF